VSNNSKRIIRSILDKIIFLLGGTMKKMSILFGFFAMSVLLSFCSKDDNSTSPQVEESDFQVSSATLDYGSDKSEMDLSISVESGKTVDWSVHKTANNKWIIIDDEFLTGTGPKTLIIKINRLRLPYGTSIDTLTITGKQRSTSKINKDEIMVKTADTTKKIVVKAQRIAQYAEIIQSNIGNGVQVLASYADSSFSLMGSFEANMTVGIKTAFASFYANGKLLCDAGNTVSYRAKWGIPQQTVINLFRYDFTYSSSSYTAHYYMPDNGKVYQDFKGSFDNTTYHSFIVTGGTDYTQPFQDSVLSVSNPVWTNSQNTVSITTDLVINWAGTTQQDDSVYAIIYAKADSTIRISAAMPVNDDFGTLTIPANKLSNLKQGGTEVYLWLIRYRVKKDNQTRRYFVCQSQKYYTFTIN
jgi:hypothetical protein